MSVVIQRGIPLCFELEFWTAGLNVKTYLFFYLQLLPST